MKRGATRSQIALYGASGQVHLLPRRLRRGPPLHDPERLREGVTNLVPRDVHVVLVVPIA